MEITTANIDSYKPSKEIIEEIKSFEKFEPKAYPCAAGVWTIGYGHTDGVKPKDQMSEPMAYALLVRRLKKDAIQIQNLIQVPLKIHQLDALVSLVYNIGIGNFKTSTLLKKLNSGDFIAAASEFPKWNKIRKLGILIPLRGLTNRRKKEQSIFLYGYQKKEPVIEIKKTNSIFEKIKNILK